MSFVVAEDVSSDSVVNLTKTNENLNNSNNNINANISNSKIVKNHSNASDDLSLDNKTSNNLKNQNIKNNPKKHPYVNSINSSFNLNSNRETVYSLGGLNSSYDSNKTIYIPSGLNSNEIQSIIDRANPGDILVFNGTYYSNIILVIKKELSLISNVGTRFDSYNRLPVITIDDTDGVLISGFNINNDIGNGIDIIDSSNVNISNSNITSSKIGINSENVNLLFIENNNIFNNGKYGITVGENNNTYIKNNIFSNNAIAIGLTESNNTNIINNTIIKNDYGIYADEVLNNLIYGKGPSNIIISNNNISNNKKAGISLINVGDGIHILNNTISNNKDNGIVLNRIGSIDIKYNDVRKNAGSGVKFSKDYIAPSNQEISYNSFVGNTFREVDARETEYDLGSRRLVIGNNWFGTSDYSKANICPKIKAGLISFGIKQIGNYVSKITFYNPDGSVVNGLPSLSISYKTGNGRSHTSSVNSGSSSFNIEGTDGSTITVTVDYQSNSITYKLNQPGYIPDDNTSYDPEHLQNQSSVDKNYHDDHSNDNHGNSQGTNNTGGNSNNSGNGTANSGNGNGESGSGSNFNNGISGSNTGANGFVGISSAATAIASSQGSSSSNSKDASNNDGASESGSGSQSNSPVSKVIKYIDLDRDNLMHAIGDFLVILIIAISICLYYRKSINHLRNN
ncbi:MAG: right-handed parallel beta-helix repeat-containing protein [Methanobrevibacter sp.]